MRLPFFSYCNMLFSMNQNNEKKAINYFTTAIDKVCMDYGVDANFL